LKIHLNLSAFLAVFFIAGRLIAVIARLGWAVGDFFEKLMNATDILDAAVFPEEQDGDMTDIEKTGQLSSQKTGSGAESVQAIFHACFGFFFG
jgi:hypothetical protein